MEPLLARRSPSREDSPGALGEFSQVRKRHAWSCALLVASTPYSHRYISVICLPLPCGIGATPMSSKNGPFAFSSVGFHQLAIRIIAVLSCEKVLTAPVKAAPLRI